MSRGKTLRVEPAERKKIVALLGEHNGNRNKVAKLCKRSVGTIQTIATQEGILSKYSAPKNANGARSAYAEERRLELIGKGFEKADELLRGIKDSTEFQKWTVGLGTLVDKARLETGEVTDRSERHNHNHPGDLENYFKELDAFRAKHGEADSREPVDTARANGKTA